MTDEELLKLTPGQLADLGICPTCFNRKTNGAFYGDDSKLKFYEDGDLECMFVPNPRAVGHMMIASKEHYHDLSEAPDKLNEKIVRFAKQLMIIIKKVYNCERVYLCTMCDGLNNHYHIQLIPRYSSEERGSKNFVKPRQKYVYDARTFTQVKNLIIEYAKKDNK